MRTTYMYSDFQKTYASVAKNVEDAMTYGVMHYIYWLNQTGLVPTPVISSVDLVAVEWKPNSYASLTLTLCVYLTNDMFFVDSIEMKDADISDKVYYHFAKNKNINYPIEYYQEYQQEELPLIVENRIKYNASLVPNNERHHVVLSFTKNTQYFHDVYSIDESAIQNYNYLSFEFDAKLDHD